MIKNICFVGNFALPYCSESQYKIELESLGYNVTCIQEDATTSDQVLDAALVSDAFFWVHSHHMSIPGSISMEIVLQKLREAGVPSFAYHLDLYMPLERWREYEDAPYFKVDHFFTVDKLMADWFNENTPTKGHFLLPGAFSGQNYIEDYSQTFAGDVAFIGNKGYHPEWPWRPQLIDWLRNTYQEQFTHWGGDGKALVREKKFNDVCASTKVIVGDTLCVGFDYPNYFSERLFNITGAGGFIIHPYIKGIEEAFEIGKEIETFHFGDFDELRGKIDYYLAHPKERNDIRLAGYLRTIKEHTYQHRLETIIKTLDNS